MLRLPLRHPIRLESLCERDSGGQTAVEITVLIMVITAAVMLMMPYLKRSSAGRIYSLISSLGHKPFGKDGTVQYKRTISRNVVTYHNFVPVNEGAASSDLLEHVSANEEVKETVSETYEASI